MNGALRATFGVVLLFAVTALPGCTTTRSTPIDEPSTLEGLQRVEIPGVDAVYRRPNVDASKYNQLLLRPIEVAFAQNWQPERSSVLYQMNEPDREKIKKDLADAFAEVFRQELEVEGGYKLVSTSGPDVLEVRAAIVNLYISAPDVSMEAPGRTRVYTTDAGEMTLIAELHDSVTGELLSRAYDRQRGGGGSWQWTNSVFNSSEARRIIGQWARTLREALDASRAKMPS